MVTPVVRSWYVEIRALKETRKNRKTCARIRQLPIQRVAVTPIINRVKDKVSECESGVEKVCEGHHDN